MNASNALLNESFAALFNTKVELISSVEPENNDLKNHNYFHKAIIEGLTTKNFYKLSNPIDKAEFLDISDIVTATFDGKGIQKMHEEMMATKNELDVIPLRRAVRRLSIERLADEWTPSEAMSVPVKRAI